MSNSMIVKIKHPVESELKDFELQLKASVKSDVRLLNIVSGYIMKRKGKQIRPVFVLLCARMFGEINESTYTGATLIELLHTATLVHDDVVDDTAVRRGAFSVNALWKNKMAVLVGDYFLSRGLIISLENNEFELLKIVTSAVKEMSEGEILQMEKARKLNITEDEYFEIIRKKTATLIASCCACGSYSATGDLHIAEQMRQFGELVGVAFQIKDDLLDYSSTTTGKGKGVDIKEQKMTLPLIHLLNQVNASQKREMIRIVKKENKNPERVSHLMRQVTDLGGITYAEKKMKEYAEKAIRLLRQFPENESRKSLEELVLYSITRSR